MAAAYKELLNKFGKGKSKVSIQIRPDACYLFNNMFKTHRHFVEFLFKSKGLEVIRHGHIYNDDGTVKEPGLIYSRTDSEIDPHMEVWGIVGVSVKPIGVVDVKDS